MTATLGPIWPKWYRRNPVRACRTICQSGGARRCVAPGQQQRQPALGPCKFCSGLRDGLVPAGDTNIGPIQQRQADEAAHSVIGCVRPGH